jgi:hypothetical protein
MTHALKLMTVLLISVAACAVDSVDSVESGTQASEDTVSPTRSTELSITDSESASGTDLITQAVTCTQVWECDMVCGRFINGVLVRFPTNVLHNECSDGTDTVLQTHPCGENCF